MSPASTWFLLATALPVSPMRAGGPINAHPARAIPGRTILLVSLGLASCLAAAEEEKPSSARAEFVVSGLECGSCIYIVQLQLSQTPGIADAEVLPLDYPDGLARVDYDPEALTEHQIAQAVREAPGLHGMPYLAGLTLRLPGFSRHADRVKALFETWRPWIELVVRDESAGELLVKFHELKRDDASGRMPRGWSLAQLTEGLRDLGLEPGFETPGSGGP
jgi:copper chaperone CopZ